MVSKQVFVPFTLAGILGATASAVAQAQQSIDELPSDLSKAVVEATYAIARTEDHVWTAPNPAQRMCSTFTADDGVRIAGGGEKRGPWSLGLELESWGRPGALEPVATVEPVALGRRIEYRRGSLTEWYVNDAQGLEQGFTLDESPAGDGLLEIVLGIGDGFTAEVRPGSHDALLRDRTTGGVLHYSGLRAWDATQRELEASLAVSGERLSIRVEDRQAVYPVTIDPWIATEEAELTASDGTFGDQFGVSVAVSGDTAVVGAAFDSHPGSMTAGSAYVFVRNGMVWSEQQKLIASDAAASDLFGGAVALSGETAVVGARSDDHAGGASSGSAYVFVRNGTVWSEQQKLIASDAAAGDFFGGSVAVSDDTVVVGANGDDTASGVEAGSAYVFVRNGTSWSEQQKLAASDAAAGDLFGSSVAVSGDTAVVGARNDDHAGGTDSGSAYVFVRDATSWSEQQKLVASDTESGDEFGISACVFGDSAVVGGWQAGGQGSAYVFVRNGASWSEQQKLAASDGEVGDSFGFSVALSGEMIVVGALDDSNAGGTAAGAAYLYVRSGMSWSEEDKLTAGDAQAFDRFGGSVALAGDTAVVGAVFGGSVSSADSGSVYVFRLSKFPAVNYCTAGTSASGCQALLSATGTPSASAASGFLLQATGVEGSKDGAFFWGKSGKQANPWGNGTSFQCVVPPVTRGGSLPGSGTIGVCDGSFAQDLNATWCSTCSYPQKNPGAGATVQAQLWYRDPLSTSNQTTSLSDAVEFVVGL